jgi:hypothetical protein
VITMEYGIQVIENYTPKRTSYFYKSSYYNRFTYDINQAHRWKTEAGANKILESFKASAQEGFKRSLVMDTLKVIELPPKPLPKFCKKKLDKGELEAVRQRVVATLLSYGWEANKEYTKNWKVPAIKDNGTGYLIDKDKHYAITVKPTVLSVHDGSREFCKILSMELKEITFEGDQLVCGRVALKIK